MSAPSTRVASLSRLPGRTRRTAALASVQGTLALDLTPRHDPPEPMLSGGGGPAAADVIDIDRAARLEVERFAARILQAFVESVGGDRPVSQVLRWTTPTVYQDLGRRAQLVARAVGRRPGQGGIQGTRPQVVGVHTCFLTQRAVEVSAHVRYGQRSRAVAARFDRHCDRWVCSALEFA